MGRPKKNPLDNLSLEQLKFVLNRAVTEGKLVASDITRMAGIKDELEALRARMDALMGGKATGKRRGRPPKQLATGGDGKQRKKRNVTPERRAAMVIQGKFLAVARKMTSASAREKFSKAYKSAESA